MVRNVLNRVQPSRAGSMKSVKMGAAMKTHAQTSYAQKGLRALTVPVTFSARASFVLMGKVVSKVSVNKNPV